MPKSTAVKVQEEKTTTSSAEGIVYSEDEMEADTEYKRRFNFARDQRDRRHRQFDDLTYLEDYQANEDATYTYLRPKLNDGEVRINTATTEKKLETVKNEILSFNFQPEVRAFDENNNEIEQLGDDFTDIIEDTNIQEKSEDMEEEALTQLLGQRALFIEEIFVDKEIEDKRARKRNKAFSKKEVLKIKIQRPEKRILDGRQVYLGDITKSARKINDQPYIIKYERMQWEEARAIYKDNPRWHFVKAGTGGSDFNAFNYRFNKNLEQNEVEIIHYFSYPDDEYQIVMNGVMMLKLGTPLPWEYEGYNITMTVTKAFNGFAYGKPLVASAKSVQGLENETIRLLVRKFRQGVEPPVGTSKKTKLKDIWEPGSIVNGLKKDDFFTLTDNNGVNNSEFAFYNLVNQITSDFLAVGAVPSGSEGEKKTAREAILLQRNFIKNLGHSILAWKRVIRDLALLRIYNVLENFTAPIGRVKDENKGKVVNVFRRFSINHATLEDGMTGRKIIQFLDRQITEAEEVAIFKKEKEEELKGKRFRFRTINVDKLRQIPIFWYVVTNPKQREGSELDKVLFTDKLNQAVGLMNVTQRPLNADKWIDSFERTYNDRDLFQEQQPAQGGGELAGEAEALQGEIVDLEKSFQADNISQSRPDRPSVNTLES